jgi:hypothetical protein
MVSREDLAGSLYLGDPGSRRVSSSTSTALTLAILGLFVPPLGVGALILGTRALRQGALTSRTRVSAMASVTLGCVALMTSTALVLAMALATPDRPPRIPVVATAAAAPEVMPDPSHPNGPHSTASLPVGHDVTMESAGSLELVRVGPAVRSLGEEITRQRELASRRGHRTLLLILAADCVPCEDVLEALASSAMQQALEGTRLITVSADQFSVELGRLGVPVDAFPGFALIGSEGRILDYVHGGEWDEDVPANIAPVLESFVRGRYDRRRDRWRGRHDDETPL